MKHTKQKILITSLALFNTHGITDVSLRTIADEIGISVGNLQYHFKKREDIIEAIYFQLVKEIDAVLFIETTSLLKSFLNISLEIFKVFYTYHFFLLDFVTITRRNKKIKKHYAELSKQRELEFLKMVAILIQNGVFRKEALKHEYKNLFKRIAVISNFWFSSVLIQVEVLSKESIEEYEQLISQSIYLYLTDNAKEEYLQLFPNQLI